MLSAGVSNLRSHGGTALALLLVAFLASVLIERRLFAPRAASAGLTTAAEEPFPALRRIVLDPCTGVERTALAGEDAKTD